MPKGNSKTDSYIRIVSEDRVSTVYFSPNEPIRFRMDGLLKPLNEELLPEPIFQELLTIFLSENDRSKLKQLGFVEKTCTIEGCGLVEASILQTKRGLAMALKKKRPSEMPSFETLGLSPSMTHFISKLTKMKNGFILFTGPASSGKSTLLSALAHQINTEQCCHLFVIQEHTEFVHKNIRSLVYQQTIGNECLNFKEAINAALQLKPDIILLDEIQDPETLRSALLAAASNTLVFGTLQSHGLEQSLTRIVDSFPVNEHPLIRKILAQTLRGVIYLPVPKKEEENRLIRHAEVFDITPTIASLIDQGKFSEITKASNSFEPEPSSLPFNEEEILLSERRDEGNLNESLINLVLPIPAKPILSPQNDDKLSDVPMPPILSLIPPPIPKR